MTQEEYLATIRSHKINEKMAIAVRILARPYQPLGSVGRFADRPNSDMSNARTTEAIVRRGYAEYGWGPAPLYKAHGLGRRSVSFG